MRLPLDWILEHLSPRPAATPQELAEIWTRVGIKVEKLERAGPPLPGVVVGQVLEAVKHPNADRLRVCRVDLGTGVASIVCGAPNVAAGQKVAVAVAGTVLPGDRKIGKAKIRGVESEGMICSEIELGMGGESDGILVLPPESEIGVPAEKALGLDAWIIEFEVTWNRPDCLSARGLARELAAAMGLTLAPLPSAAAESGAPVATLASLGIVDATLCSHYAARVVSSLRPSESPEWLRTRLKRAGLRTVNAIVDVTQYVMLDLGQPLHAFDLEKLIKRPIGVRKAKVGERIELLDGVSHSQSTLPDGTTLAGPVVWITAGDEPEAMAGVMGGQGTKVTEATTAVLLESARFTPEAIQRSARASAIRSDASVRFSGGTDPALVRSALDRAATMLTEICGGQVASGVLEVGAPLPAAHPLVLRRMASAAAAGFDIPDAEGKRALERLGFSVVAGGEWNVTAPSHRMDVTGEADLVEEIVRSVGYDRIPEVLPPARVDPACPPSLLLERRVRSLLAGWGLLEAKCFGLEPVGIAEAGLSVGERVELLNALSSDHAVLRSSLLRGLLDAADRNLRHGVQSVALFEIGRAFRHDKKREASDPVAMESRRIAAVYAGTSGPRHWQAAPRGHAIHDATGLADALVQALGIEPIVWQAADVPGAKPGHGAVWEVDGSRVAVALDAASSAGCVGLEIDLDWLLRAAAGEFRPAVPPRHPSVRRDLALILETHHPAAGVLSAIRGAGGDRLRGIEVFDVYSGDPVPSGRRQIAFGLEFRADDRSLSSDEVDGLVQGILAAVKQGFGAEPRGA